MEVRALGFKICALALGGTFPFSAHADPLLIQPIEIRETQKQDVFSRRTQLQHSQSATPELLESEVRGLQDSLNEIPGITATSSGSPTISIRGSGQTTRVLGLWNGVNLNLNDPFGTNTLLLPREILQEAEIIKTPTGTALGSGATGGAINFVSRNISSPLTRTNVGSFGQKGVLVATPLLSAEQNRQGKQLQFSIFQESADGNFDYQVPRLNQAGQRTRNDSHLWRGVLTGSQTWGSGWTIYENFIWARQMGSTPAMVSGSTGSPSAVENEGLLSALTIEKIWNDRWSSSLRSSLVDVKNRSLFQSVNPVPGSYQSRRWSQSLSVTQKESDYSIEYFADSNLSEYRTLSAANQTFTRHEPEFGVIAQINLFEDVVASPGVRYLSQYGRWVKSLAVTQERQLTEVFFRYSEGFTAPNMSLLYEDSPANSVQSNLSLVPEESEMTEIGFRHRPSLAPVTWQDRWLYGLSVFRTNYNQLLVARQNPSNGFTRTLNASHANVYGVEAELGIRHRNYAFSFEYAYLDSTDETGQKALPRVPRNHVALTNSIGLGPLVFELKGIYLGPYQLATLGGGSVEFEPTTTWDFTVRTQALLHWSARMGVLNLTDQSREWTLGFPEPQRRFFASLEYQL